MSSEISDSDSSSENENTEEEKESSGGPILESIPAEPENFDELSEEAQKAFLAKQRSIANINYQRILRWTRSRVQAGLVADLTLKPRTFSQRLDLCTENGELNCEKILKEGMTFDSQQAMELCVAECFDLLGLVHIKKVKNPSRVVIGIAGLDEAADKFQVISTKVTDGTDWVVQVVNLPDNQEIKGLKPKIVKRHCSFSVIQLVPLVLETVRANMKCQNKTVKPLLREYINPNYINRESGMLIRLS